MRIEKITNKVLIGVEKQLETLVIARKLSEDLALYRILNKSRSSKRLKNIYASDLTF